MDLNIFWFAVIGVLLSGYAILDGFDLGVGIVYYAARTDNERRLFLNSIGPLWDGNEVWLVTFGGALFAAFPEAYATAFSAYYLPFMALLCALIFRAVSMEFRSKAVWPFWRKFWDFSFFAACTACAFIFGLAVGNSMLGIPIGADHEYLGGTSELISFFPVLVGLFVVALFAMHGSIYLYLKTDGELQERLQALMWRTFGLFLVTYLFTTIYTLVSLPYAVQNFRLYPVTWVAVFLNVLAVANIPRAIYLGKPLYAFFSSACTIAALTFLFGAALYPNLMVSSLKPEWSLTIYNAASSATTLGLMRIVCFLGMPFVICYTGVVYWVFRGKVKLNATSY
jgi:cytochrome bd ubiquinol oxidase subunit II